MIEEPVEEASGGAPEWMVTFADLMSLLLTFFVLLLSFSNMEIVKFRTMAGSVKNALGLKSEIDLSDIPSGHELMPHLDPKEGDGQAPPQESVTQNARAQMLVTRLRELVEQSGIEGEAQLKLRPEGVSLELDGDLLFDSGKAELRKEALPVLASLSRFMQTFAGAIDVEGHTDDVPISNSRFPSNWELSSARAGRAVRFLSGRGVEPRRLRAVGYADSVPATSNANAQGRQSNRRVAFLFLAEDPAGLETVDPRLESFMQKGTPQ